MAIQNLDGKVAVITGGANGIGRAIAEALLAEGASVCLADIEPDSLASTANELTSLVRAGRRVVTRVADVTKFDSMAGLADFVARELGPVHLLCANAGATTPEGGAPDEAPLEEWRRMIDINYFGVVHTLRAFLPGMRAAPVDSHIVVTGSSAGLLATGNRAAYCGAKHAVIGLTESLSLQLKPTRIRVSLLCPGVTATRMIGADLNRSADARGRALPAHLLAQAKPPAEIARQVVDAVKQGRFWILTHEDLKPAVIARAQAMAGGDAPPDSYH